MKTSVLIISAAALCWSCGNQQSETPDVEIVEVDPMEDLGPVVLNGEKHIPECAAALQAMGNGDIEGFTALMDENIVYQFSYGDSIAGKTAVQEWWRNRWDTEIESLSFSDHIWLSIDAIDQPTTTVEAGEYVLAWFTVTASYKTGKSMTQFIHVVYHFNQAGMVDRVTQFMDRVPIMEATS